MAKFTFNIIYQSKNGEYLDDENVWVTARDKFEAMSKVKEEYCGASEFTLLKSE